ncbi:MAG: LPS export ABC transporter permease LptG [Nitrospira sp.]|nr:LPS export ABC transporter permease LptG [Nitrospira sp.]
MTILFRYMLREVAKVFVMCLSGLMTVYLVIDFFEKVRKFIRYDVDLATMAEYFALRTPGIFFQIAPLAVLMATLLTLGVFARNKEVTAMQSCGISLARIAAPFLLFSLSIAIALFVCSAVIIPYATTQAEYVKTVKIEKKPGALAVTTDRSWIQIGERTLMNFDVVAPDGFTLHGITLYQLGEDFRLVRMTESASAHYTTQGWALQDGVHRYLLPDGTVRLDPFERAPLPLSQTPDDFSAWLSTETEEMTLADLHAYTNRLRKDGYNVARFLTDYYGRIAFPFVSVVMAIVGVALSLRQIGARGRGMAVGIGLALVIGFLYWSTHSVAIALGHSGALTPVLAGWLANLLFVSFGSALFLQVRQ